MPACVAGREEGLDKTSGPAGLARALRRYTKAVVTVVDDDGKAKRTTRDDEEDGGRRERRLADG